MLRERACIVDVLIDLDAMFETDKPLGEWIRETEILVFDGNEANPMNG